MCQLEPNVELYILMYTLNLNLKEYLNFFWASTFLIFSNLSHDISLKYSHLASLVILLQDKSQHCLMIITGKVKRTLKSRWKKYKIYNAENKIFNYKKEQNILNILRYHVNYIKCLVHKLHFNPINFFDSYLAI